MAAPKTLRRPRPRIVRETPAAGTVPPASSDGDAVRAAFADRGQPAAGAAAPGASPPISAAPAWGEGPITDLERQAWADQVHGLFKAAEESRGKHWHVPDAQKHVWGDYPALAARKYGIGAGAPKYPELMLLGLLIPYIASGLRGEWQAYVEWRDGRKGTGPQRRPADVVPFPASVSVTTPPPTATADGRPPAGAVLATPDFYTGAAPGGDERGGIRDQGVREIPPGTAVVGRAIEGADFRPAT